MTTSCRGAFLWTRPLFLRTFCWFALYVASLLTLPLSACAQTLRIESNNPVYRFLPVKGYEPKVDDKGVVTTRVIVEQQYLGVPNASEGGSYYTYKPPVELDLTKGGVLGKRLGGNKIDIGKSGLNIDLTTGLITNPRDGVFSDALFNEVRAEAGREVQVAFREAVVGKTVSIVNDQGAFIYGDWLNNARAARALAWKGKLQIDGGKESGIDLKDLSGSVRVIRDPANPLSATTAPLNVTSLQDYSQWFFEVHEVESIDGQPADKLSSEPIRMLSVRVRWVFEAKFPSNKVPRISLARATINKAATEAAQTQPAGDPKTDTTGSGTGGTGSQPLADLGGFGTAALAADGHGLDVVIGIAALNNHVGGMAGVNLTPFPPPGKEHHRSRYFGYSWGDLGILAGRTTGGPKDWIIAPSYKINSNALVYVGVALNDPQGTFRNGPAFGVAIRLRPIINGAEGRPNTDQAAGELLKAGPLALETPDEGREMPPAERAADVDAGLVFETIPPRNTGEYYVAIFANSMNKPNGPVGVFAVQITTPGDNFLDWIDWVRPANDAGAELVNLLLVSNDGTKRTVLRSLTGDLTGVKTKLNGQEYAAATGLSAAPKILLTDGNGNPIVPQGGKPAATSLLRGETYRLKIGDAPAAPK